MDKRLTVENPLLFVPESLRGKKIKTFLSKYFAQGRDFVEDSASKELLRNDQGPLLHLFLIVG